MKSIAKGAATKPTRAKSISEYIAAAPPSQRAGLTKLRSTIKSAAPKATEGISYGMAAFKHKGDSLMLFAYWKDHVALYGSFDAYAKELAAYDQSGRGTFRFPNDEPLPYSLVTKMVRAKVIEIEKARRTHD